MSPSRRLFAATMLASLAASAQANSHDTLAHKIKAIRWRESAKRQEGHAEPAQASQSPSDAPSVSESLRETLSVTSSMTAQSSSTASASPAPASQATISLPFLKNIPAVALLFTLLGIILILVIVLIYLLFRKKATDRDAAIQWEKSAYKNRFPGIGPPISSPRSPLSDGGDDEPPLTRMPGTGIRHMDKEKSSAQLVNPVSPARIVFGSSEGWGWKTPQSENPKANGNGGGFSTLRKLSIFGPKSRTARNDSEFCSPLEKDTYTDRGFVDAVQRSAIEEEEERWREEEMETFDVDAFGRKFSVVDLHINAFPDPPAPAHTK